MYNEAEKQQQLKDISSKIVKIQILGAPGTILVGLALYAIFGANGDAFHPILNNMDVVYSMMLIGIAIMVWEFATFISLLRKRAKLVKDDP